MSSIDWNKCPQATHFAPKRADDEMWCDVFWRVVDGVGVEAWAVVSDGLTHFSKPSWGAENAGRLIARPMQWSGEGLPPVGTELEAGFACEEFENWHKGVCIASGEDPEGRQEFCVVQFGKKLAMYTTESGRMRPIRTAEQIAADERLHEVRNALTAISSKVLFPNDLVRGNILAAAVEAMIDAGYRKVTP